VESSRSRRDIEGDAPRPRLQFEVVFMDVVEALQSQVNAAKDVHGFLRRARCVPVAALDAAHEPNVQIQVEDREVIERHRAIPPAENVHVVLIDHGSVPKTNLRLQQLFEVLTYLALLDK